MYIIYDKTSTENGRVIIIELKGKKCEGILIFGTGFHVLKKRNDPTFKQIDEQNNPVVKH